MTPQEAQAARTAGFTSILLNKYLSGHWRGRGSVADILRTWSGTTPGRLEREAVLEMEPSGLFLEPGILSKGQKEAGTALLKLQRLDPK